MSEKKNPVFETLDMQIVDPHDLNQSLQHAINEIYPTIKPPVKIQLYIHVKYKKENEDVKNWVSTKQWVVEKDVSDKLKEKILQDFYKASDEAKLRGSGWTVGEVLKIELRQSKYHPILGKSYVPLDPKLTLKKGIVNIQNDDDKCFMWSVLAKLYPVKSNANKVSSYRNHVDKLDFADVQFPVKVEDIDIFEENNNLSINVYTWDRELDDETGCGLQPLRLSEHSPTFEEPGERHIDLCLIGDHYTLIKNMSRLIHQTSKHKGKQFLCRKCLKRVTTVNATHEHSKHCKSDTDVNTVIKLPPEGSTVSFKNIAKLQKAPYVVYADFEALNVKYQGPTPEKLPKTVALTNHQVCSFAYIIVRSDGEASEPYHYRGEDAAEYFLKCMMKLYYRCKDVLNLKKLAMTDVDKANFEQATECWICRKKLGCDRVRDHDHITGKFRGAAHSDCNLQLKVDPKTWKLPIFFHNLRGYDSHIIMQAVTEKYKTISCIAQSMEKYMSFRISNLQFYDSVQHLVGSLDSLTKSLKEFPITTKYYETDLIRKGVYPYEYMDSWDRFDEIRLPPKGAFYSKLRDADISDKDYEHAQKVWEELDCKNLGDYHDHYLIADVLLLADVFENYRKIAMNYYELDPAHYISSPGLSWDAFFRFTDVKIDLIHDERILKMVESGLRGGISMACHSYCKANNKYLDDYDSTKPSNYIIYLDANNLYGWAMTQYLPIRNLKLEEGSFDEVITMLNRKGPDDKIGWFLEVDLGYPEELHDYHNSYPLAVEKIGIDNVAKLVPNLRNKKNYVCHYRLLQFYLRHGLILRKVHRIVSFEQTDFMKSYIDKNTLLRSQSKTTSEKDFFKLINLACFGKTVENVRKRKNIELVTDPQKAIKLVSKPNYQGYKQFNDDLYGVSMKKLTVTMDKPVFIGCAVLELSKLLMLEFYYDYFKIKHPKAEVLYTDTDSLVINVPTDDIYKDFESEKDVWYDFSDYPEDHPLHSNLNKKKVGYMKDELNGKIIKEYVGLRSKMYSIVTTSKNIRKAKGVSKVVVEKQITHENYKQALFEDKQFTHDNIKINSTSHQINTTKLNKKSLSSEDTKRVRQIPTFSYAIGHYMNALTEEIAEDILNEIITEELSAALL